MLPIARKAKGNDEASDLRESASGEVPGAVPRSLGSPRAGSSARLVVHVPRDRQRVRPGLRGQGLDSYPQDHHELARAAADQSRHA